MPIHELGYRSWDSRCRWGGQRWWVIAQTGILLAWKSHWVRRMLFLAWLPAIYMGLLLFGYEQATTRPGGQAVALKLLSELPNSAELQSALSQDPEEARGKIWGFILLTFFRYPQGVLMVMLVGLIAPSLIARDMRSRAFLLYFSRPVDRFDYLLGKCVVVWTYLAMVTTVPAMALYVLGVLLSPDLHVVATTWDLPLRILAASAWLMLPTTAIALCFSSLTNESRYAGFAWFVIWVLGWVAYVNLTLLDVSRVPAAAASGPLPDRWALVSLYHSLGRVQSWIFGLHADQANLASGHQTVPLGPILLLAVVTFSSFGILFRRIAAPLRV